MDIICYSINKPVFYSGSGYSDTAFRVYRYEQVAGTVDA